MQTWALYERGALESIVDTYLDDDLDMKQACNFLKIGLLCTQDASKVRPSMSTVVRLLTSEIDINSLKITKPGLISDFFDLSMEVQKKAGAQFPFQASSCHDSGPETSPLSSENTTHISTFTGISD